MKRTKQQKIDDLKENFKKLSAYHLVLWNNISDAFWNYEKLDNHLTNIFVLFLIGIASMILTCVNPILAKTTMFLFCLMLIIFYSKTIDKLIDKHNKSILKAMKKQTKFIKKDLGKK